MTDPGPLRTLAASSVKAFPGVSPRRDCADIREGQDFPKLWATWHYDWSTPDSVTLSITDSDALQPGGFMTLTAAPKAGGGSSVHGVWEQSSKNLTGLAGVTMMRLIGPRFLSSYYKKVYDGL